MAEAARALQERPVAPPRWRIWTGWIFTVLPAAMMIASGSMKVLRAAPVVATWGTAFGYPEATMVPIGLVEIACAVTFLVPRTAVLGGVLMAAYLGGAVATHVRVADFFVPPIVFGVLAWGGLWLRDARVRALLPLRGPAADE